MHKKQRKQEKTLEEVGVVVGYYGKFWFLKRIRYLGRRKMMNLRCPWEESSCIAAELRRLHGGDTLCRSWKTEIPTKLVVVTDVQYLNFFVFFYIWEKVIFSIN